MDLLSQMAKKQILEQANHPIKFKASSSTVGCYNCISVTFCHEKAKLFKRISEGNNDSGFLDKLCRTMNLGEVTVKSHLSWDYG